MTITEDAVSSALTSARGILEADGYDLRASVADDRVVLRVVALDDACPDCLVPKHVMEQILRASLPSGLTELTLVYPDEAGEG